MANAPFLIDGKAVSTGVLAAVKAEAEALKGSVTPGLAVVLVGADPASQVYVGAKGRAAKQCGFHSLQYDLPETTDRSGAARARRKAERRPRKSMAFSCNCRCPKPSTSTPGAGGDRPGQGCRRLSSDQCRARWRSATFERALIPCTPAGAMILIDRACEALGRKLDGAEAVVVGRSNIVGKPMAQLLLVAQLHGDDRPFAHPRPARASRGAPMCWSPRSGGRRWCAATGSSPARSSSTSASTASPAPEAAARARPRLVGDVAFTEASARAGGDHAGSRRRRADDDRDADGEHVEGGAARPNSAVQKP